MKIVGLTGGIGTGKSTVAQIFGSFGAVIVDSDAIAKAYLSKGMTGYDMVVKRYGSQILDKRLELKREKIAGKVFKNTEERRWLESLVHPYVYERIKYEIENNKDKTGIMIIDVPLLFETGADKWLRPVIVVICDRYVQIKRIRQRNSEMSYEHIIERMHAQLPIEQKQKNADFVIDNSFSIEHTSRQVKKIISELTGG